MIFGAAYQYISYFKWQRINCETSQRLEFPEEVDKFEISTWE